ncbi:ABC transporter permease [Rhizohabitans arisaemae]|uniref:ABC transporter permease n=1 Tax=Rhizohabitans arisaemae TaxID=2720610 RepID=UPI0024B187A5|nr:ABC transporter permease [Rhizohabitans arisaemae]
MGRAAARVAGAGWLVALLLAAWEVYARIWPSVFFPPLSEVLGNFSRMWLSADASSLFTSDLLREQAGTSLGRFAMGWLLAVVVGVTLGMLLGRSPVASRMYNPTVRFFTAVPNTMLLPIAVQIFGITSRMNVFLIFLGTVWVIIINTADGVAGVDEMWLRSARSLRLSRWTLYRSVVIPAAMPRIMTGLRVSLGIGLILMIISELYATTVGLGFQIVVAEKSFLYVDMWSAFVLVGLIGIVLNSIFTLVERRVLRWQRRSSLSDL